jgi:hemerythrin-like metal-binding protein
MQQLYPFEASMFLEWNESYEIGVPVIDRQHKQLFALIDELQRQMENADESVLVSDVIRRLADYTHYHFSFEENLMELYEYPDIEHHKELHLYFREEMATLFTRHLEGDSSVTVHAYKALIDWILNHVTSADAQADQHYATHIKSHPDGADAFKPPDDNPPSAA